MFADGSGVDETFSSNVADTNVTKRVDAGMADLTGQYCFHDLPFSVTSAQVTVEPPTLGAQTERTCSLPTARSPQ